MRRLLRILLNAATVLSLVLCAATMGAWVRSYQARDIVSWVTNPRMVLQIDTYRGGLIAEIFTRSGDVIPFEGEVAWNRYTPMSYADAGPTDTFFNRFGFGSEYSGNGEQTARDLACPYWFIMVLTAILPGARLAGWRRRARGLRMRPGLCRHCGYDCRATPDRCPECGTAMLQTKQI
jgi:hypothetical protein